MEQALTINRLSRQNLKRKPVRTYALIMIVAILAFVLFGGNVLSLSLKNGLSSVKARLGADLIIVPLGCEAKQKAILLAGEPSYFYFDKEIVAKLQDIEGIASLSVQFYLTSLNASCCSIPVQIIGFDPTTDFSIRPWINEAVGGDIDKGALVIGSDILLEANEKIIFFDKEYPVAARLDKTGTGLDTSVFADLETIQELFLQAKSKGLNFLKGTDPASSISSVLIKTEDGYDVEQLVTNIRRAVDGIQIVKTQGLITGISKSLGSFINIFRIFAFTILGVTLLILSVIFSATANERKKEFATLRILGATGKRLAGMILLESLYISGIGGMIGIVLAAAVVFPFNVYIGDRLGLPYLMPSLLWILAVLAVTILVAAAAGPISSAYSVFKISRSQTYITLREGE
jgi:putative ABC transport system permease protein